MLLASTRYESKGLVLDYTTISSGGATYTFTNGSTFYISTFVTFTSTVAFQSNSILKYATSAGLYLRGPVSCSNTMQNPSILTSANENIFGQVINGSTGSPTYSANEAIWLDVSATPRRRLPA
jgi:hypothetical protein